MLKEIIDSGEKIDRVFSIGPAVMMKAVVDMTKPYSLPTIVSLNSLMVCGMGMCGACRVTIGGETKFTCMDGPDFDGHKVDFEELLQRLATYKTTEQSCMDQWSKGCADGNK
jgi:ferredoxin--NADP+ reductase